MPLLPQVQVVADSSGAWTRYLGLELGAPGAPGPRSLRYAAIVDDGVLLKLVGALPCLLAFLLLCDSLLCSLCAFVGMQRRF